MLGHFPLSLVREPNNVSLCACTAQASKQADRTAAHPPVPTVSSSEQVKAHLCGQVLCQSLQHCALLTAVMVTHWGPVRLPYHPPPHMYTAYYSDSKEKAMSSQKTPHLQSHDPVTTLNLASPKAALITTFTMASKKGNWNKWSGLQLGTWVGDLPSLSSSIRYHLI